MDVKNMTAGEIATMSLEQFNSLTAAEAKQALNKVRRSVNQRLRRLDAAIDYTSPARQQLKKSGGGSERLRPASSSRNENLAELKRGMNFLKSQTGTVTGARAHFNKAKEYLGLSDDATKEDIREAYEEFEKIQEEFGGLLSKEAGLEKYDVIKRALGSWHEQGVSTEELKRRLKDYYIKAEKGNFDSYQDIVDSINREVQLNEAYYYSV